MDSKLQSPVTNIALNHVSALSPSDCAFFFTTLFPLHKCFFSSNHIHSLIPLSYVMTNFYGLPLLFSYLCSILALPILFSLSFKFMLDTSSTAAFWVLLYLDMFSISFLTKFLLKAFFSQENFTRNCTCTSSTSYYLRYCLSTILCV